MKSFFLLLITLLSISALSAQLNLDSTFATNGFTQDISNLGIAHEIAVQPDGKILMAMGRRKLYANSNSSDEFNFYCARYMPDGSLDIGFGTNGLAKIGGIPRAEAMFVGIQSDGKIILAGKAKYCGPLVCGFDNIIIGRLHPDGQHDTTFGISLASPYVPKTITAAEEVFGDLYLGTEIKGMQVLANDQIVIAGNSQVANSFAWTTTIYHSFIARLNKDGSVDSSYSSSGNGVFNLPARYQNGNWGSIEALKMDGLGNMYLAGSRTVEPVPGQYEFNAFVGKVFPTGHIDSTYGTDGVVDIDFGSRDRMPSIDVDARGNVLLGGHQTGYGDSATVVLLNPQGQFSTDMPGGHAYVNFPKNEKGFIYAARFDQQGRICIAGHYYTAAVNTRIGYAGRLNRNGTWDASFTSAGTGIDTLNLSIQSIHVATIFHDMHLLPNGQMLLSGERFHKTGSTEPMGILVRLNPADVALGNGQNLAETYEMSVFPNPLAQHSAIQYTLPQPSTVSIDVLDLQGKVVDVLQKSQAMTQGKHELGLGNLAQHSKGLHIIRVKTEKGQAFAKVML
ncbi:MAG: T9SS type A sorting domain-containing protein [Bacteroidia bacterium]